MRETVVRDYSGSQSEAEYELRSLRVTTPKWAGLRPGSGRFPRQLILSGEFERDLTALKKGTETVIDNRFSFAKPRAIAAVSFPLYATVPCTNSMNVWRVFVFGIPPFI